MREVQETDVEKHIQDLTIAKATIRGLVLASSLVLIFQMVQIFRKTKKILICAMLRFMACENVILKSYKWDDNVQINPALYHRFLF